MSQQPTIGILGGGQLGRMDIIAGRPMGLRFRIFEPNTGNAAGMVADADINASYSDLDALTQFAAGCDVVTLEFENIPADVLDHLSAQVPLRPGRDVLHICQHRLREKTFLRDHGFPHAAFREVEGPEALAGAIRDLGVPSVLKTAAFGYDGKGQMKLENVMPEDAGDLWNEFSAPLGVVESWIDFRAEYSVIVARTPSGEVATFPLFENVHRNHILHTTTTHVDLPSNLQTEAEELAMALAEQLKLEGLLTVELFLSTDDRWLVNEMAPRPHNSGHITLDAFSVSQFEQHLRAVLDWPLGNTQPLSPGCMVNLLGNLWTNQTPPWEKVLRMPGAHLHLYDKGEPRLGRKMGHINMLAPTRQSAQEQALAIWQKLH